jgi:hypothetical protein
MSWPFQTGALSYTKRSIATLILTEFDSYTATPDDNGTLGNGTHTRRAQKFTTSYTYLGNTIDAFEFQLSKTGSPTGTLTARIRNSGDSVVAEYGTLDVSTLTGTLAVTRFYASASPRVLADGDRISVEYSGGDVSNYVLIGRKNSGVKSNTQSSAYAGSWSDGTEDNWFKLYNYV